MFSPFDYPEIKKLFSDLISTLFKESGRGALLVATAHVDDQLTQLLEAVMPQDISNNHKDRLFKYPGALSSFSAKIELAYVFRLITKNLYLNLNALKKIRNDAAHSTSNLQLHELNEKLKSIYDLGPGFSSFIKQVSMKAIVQNKAETLKNFLDESDLTNEQKQEIFESTLKDKEAIKTFEHQVPFWELLYGLTFLCSSIVHHKEKLRKLTNGINTLSQLVKDNNNDEEEKRTANKSIYASRADNTHFGSSNKHQ